MPDMEALREWVQQDDVKKQAAAAEKKASKRCKELEEPIMQSLIEDGVPSIKVTLEAVDVDAKAEDAARLVLVSISDARSEAERTELAAEIVAALREDGLLAESRPSITKTVFIGRRFWARPVATGEDDNGDPKATEEDYRRACRALEAAEWGGYVQERFNIISLSSAVKEEVEQGRITIPEGDDSTLAFDETIVVTEQPQLNSRKAAK